MPALPGHTSKQGTGNNKKPLDRKTPIQVRKLSVPPGDGQVLGGFAHAVGAALYEGGGGAGASGDRRRNLRRVTRRCGRSSRAAIAAGWRPWPLAARSAPLLSHALAAAARMRQAAPAPARSAVTATAAPAAVGSLSATGPR